ncbi:MAG TPA: hypothetical protein VN203_25665 [Candidatus Acidoferrum sp.]|nr:hypothetical protein [Candidatus Acidoferrum sp.]
MLIGTVCGELKLQDSEDRERPFYRLLTADQSKAVRSTVQRLVDWKMWQLTANDEIDQVLAGNKSQVKEWFKKKGLTTGYLMGAPE